MYCHLFTINDTYEHYVIKRWNINDTNLSGIKNKLKAWLQLTTFLKEKQKKKKKSKTEPHAMADTRVFKVVGLPSQFSWLSFTCFRFLSWKKKTYQLLKCL